MRAIIMHLANRPALGRSTFFACCVLLVCCYAILLAGALPSFPLGGSGDFLVTYSAARILRDGHASRLYDLEFLSEVQRNLLATYQSGLAHGPLPYLHPPLFAAIFIPFTFLTLRSAFYLWIVLSLITLIACVKLLHQRLKLETSLQFPALLLIVLAYYPTFETSRKGQSSFLLLWAVTLFYLGLKQRSNLMAGIALGAAVMKPQIAFFLAAVLLYKRSWRPLMAFGATASVLSIGSWLMVGTEGLISYVRITRDALAWNGSYHVSLSAMPNLRGAVAGLLLRFGIQQTACPIAAASALPVILASLAVIALTARAWRGPLEPGSARFDLCFAQAILASILLTPYLYWHDLSLLILAGVLLLGQLSLRGSTAFDCIILVTGHLCTIPVASLFFGTDISALIVVLVIAVATVRILRRISQEAMAPRRIVPASLLPAI
ncbi:MAG: DUF2029 domain-containing protein [Acidobacteria bacterium]|nr:DUF2029 domain-containing protein [Acidobacteriota bacterium]